MTRPRARLRWGDEHTVTHRKSLRSFPQRRPPMFVLHGQCVMVTTPAQNAALAAAEGKPSPPRHLSLAEALPEPPTGPTTDSRTVPSTA